MSHLLSLLAGLSPLFVAYEEGGTALCNLFFAREDLDLSPLFFLMRKRRDYVAMDWALENGVSIHVRNAEGYVCLTYAAII